VPDVMVQALVWEASDACQGSRLRLAVVAGRVPAWASSAATGCA